LFGHINAIFDISKNLGIFTAVKYQGKMNVPHEVLVEGIEEPFLRLENVPSFVELDFGVTYNLQLINNFSTKLSIGVKNLTDAYQDDLDFGVNRDPGYVYGPANPRTLYFSIETSF
jgi:outer membrane receptor for ferrienterochelin and colicins